MRVACAAAAVLLLSCAVAQAEPQRCATRQQNHFSFGSYGRVGAATDAARGGKARSLNVVGHGPRLEEPPYVELDLGYSRKVDDRTFSVLFTLALGEDLFHYNGQFNSDLAIRNLFAQSRNLLLPRLELWVGSRMARGDDIYLLDYWPLDDLNIVGGGVAYSWAKTRFALGVGVNRIDDLFQHQEITVAAPRFGTQPVVVLDRQRTVASLKVSRVFNLWFDKLLLKPELYAEIHHIPQGTLQREQQQRETLPSDLGWVFGAHLRFASRAASQKKMSGFVDVWGRVAGGIAAYDELGIPFGLDENKRTTRAREAVVAVGGALQRRWLGAMLGSYLRYFADADGNAIDYDDGWEFAVALRPYLLWGRHFQQHFELSLQTRRPDGLDPVTQTHLVPVVAKLSVMPTLSWGRGGFSRPQLRLIYTASYLDSDARSALPRSDLRHGVALHHFIGAQAEWWFNSSYRRQRR